MQIIYGGKTTASQPRGFQFPKGFCLSQNPKHWSNEQKAVVVFKGQMTDAVKQKLLLHSTELVAVSANMTLLSTTRSNSKSVSKEVHEETIYCLLQLSCETAT